MRERIKKLLHSIRQWRERRKNDCLFRALLADDYHRKSFSLPVFDSPEVTIVIPVFNQYAMTRRCLISILRNTQDVQYKVCIADDASIDATKNIAQYIKNLHVIRQDFNRGFLYNVNHALQFVDTSYVMLINNDMLVKKGWLFSLLQHIRHNDDIGIVGAKMLLPNGNIQEIGGSVDADARTSWNEFGSCNRKEYEKNLYEVDCCSGCGILFRKKDWDVIRGFDTQFAPAYFEDVDFCFSMRYQLGLKVVCDPYSEIYHLHSRSYGGKAKTYIDQNREKFAKKWHHILQQH